MAIPPETEIPFLKHPRHPGVKVQTARFKNFRDGTREEHLYILAAEDRYAESLGERIINAVAELGDVTNGFPISRLEHSLQSASRALRDGRDEEYVVAALIHDIGDNLAPFSHGEMIAAIMKPFFSERMCWIVSHHPAFQQFYYGHNTGDDPNARDAWCGHVWFDDCVEFCERYDENCFDAEYVSLQLADFEPMVHRVFSKRKTAV